MASSVCPSYKPSVQLDFGWFSVMIFLFSCNFDVVVRDGKQSVYLLYSLDTFNFYLLFLSSSEMKILNHRYLIQ